MFPGLTNDELKRAHGVLSAQVGHVHGGRAVCNVTGLFLDQPSIAGKWIELLREAAPSIERVALVWDPTSGADQLDAAKAAARNIACLIAASACVSAWSG
jgi:hypothetical protein